MSIIENSKKKIGQAVAQAFEKAVNNGAFTAPADVNVAEKIQLEVPKDEQYGDFACNIAMLLAKMLSERAETLFLTRYKLKKEEIEGLDCYDLFELVGRKRGFLISGGEIDHKRCAEMLLEEFRSAKIGRISLEAPEE